MFQRRIELHAGLTAEDVPEWNSLAHINLRFATEQEFGVQFPGNVFAEFKTVGELKDYLRDAGA